VPLALALGAAAADGAGLHRVAFYLVLTAVPAAAAVALCAAADLADGLPVTARAACSAAALVLLVISSAVRANAAVGAQVPRVALSALVGSVCAYALLGLAWLLWAPRAEPEPVPVREH
jgi:phytoene/squalene synthetase